MSAYHQSNIDPIHETYTGLQFVIQNQHQSINDKPELLVKNPCWMTVDHAVIIQSNHKAMYSLNVPFAAA